MEFVTAAEHVLGCEYPNHIPPREYRPELLPHLWRKLDAIRADQARAETILTQLETVG